MATIASLLVKIGADTGDLRRELNATKRQIKTAFGSDFMSVSQKAAGALVGIGVALAGVGIAAVKVAASYQNTQIALTNMLGSAEKANVFLKEMQAFAAKTPFSFSDVTQASQKFLAFGFTAEQIIPTLTAVGDAAAGVGAGKEGVNRLTLALGQIATKGKLASQEVMQITELGIPAWKLLADAMGTSIADVQEKVSKGAVDSQTALEALVGGMGSTYAGLMDAQSKGIGGSWSAMMDGIEQSAAQIGLKISEAFALPDVFNGIGDTLSEFAAKVETSGIAEAFRTIIPPELQFAIVGIGTALTMIAIPAISLAATSLIAFAAPLIAAVAAFAPFIAGVTAVVGGLYALWQSGVTVADVFKFLSVNTETLDGLWNALKSTAQSVSNLVTSYFNALKPVFIGVLAVGGLAFVGLGKLIGFLINSFSLLVTNILGAIRFIADGISAWYTFVGDKINGLGDTFMHMADNVLPAWVSNGLKAISDFVDKAVNWLSKLLGKVNETNAALGDANSGGDNNKDKEKDKGSPTFEQFKSKSGTKSGGGKSGGSSANNLATQAESTSKSIADAWYDTFSTKSELIDRWYQEELAALNKSAAANENYERDKKRLVELYGQKRLEALQEEAKKAFEIEQSVRDLSFSSREGQMSLVGSVSVQEQQKMLLEYEKGIAAIDDRWAQLSQNYLGYTEQEKAAFLNSLNERNIAYKINAENEIEFEKEKNTEKLALAKNYYDQVAEYHANCTDIKKEIDDAYRTYDMERLREVLTEEAAIRLNDMEAKKSMMDTYQEAFLAAHQTSAQLVADMYSTAFSGLSDAFTDILTGAKSAKAAFGDLGKAMIKTVAQFYAKQLAGMIINAAMGSSIDKKRTADSVARASTELAAWTPVAVAYATLHPGAAAKALAEVSGSLTGAVTFAKSISSALKMTGGSESKEPGAMPPAVRPPGYAKGGLFTRPLLGILGDGAEDEVALPLSKAVFQNIADGIVNAGGSGSEGANITQNIYGDINTGSDEDSLLSGLNDMLYSSGLRSV